MQLARRRTRLGELISQPSLRETILWLCRFHGERWLLFENWCFRLTFYWIIRNFFNAQKVRATCACPIRNATEFHRRDRCRTDDREERKRGCKRESSRGRPRPVRFRQPNDVGVLGLVGDSLRIVPRFQQPGNFAQLSDISLRFG